MRTWTSRTSPSVGGCSRGTLQSAGGCSGTSTAPRPRTVTRERARVATTGWGARLLEEQNADGGWGRGVYSPKWTSTTYTLLRLMWLGLPPGHPAAARGMEQVWQWQARWQVPETCIASMLVRLTCYHAYVRLSSTTARRRGRGPARPAAGRRGLELQDAHRQAQARLVPHQHPGARGARRVRRCRRPARDRRGTAPGPRFFLRHRLYRSHRTGEVAIPGSTRFPAFPEWHFDVLRGLEHFAAVDAPRDARLGDAVEVLVAARRRDGRWPTYAQYPGRQWFRIEPPGPSRWDTCRVLRVLRWWDGTGRGSKVPSGSARLDETGPGRGETREAQRGTPGDRSGGTAGADRRARHAVATPCSGRRCATGAIVNAPVRSVADLPAGWGDEQDAGTYRLRRRDDAALFGFAAGAHSGKPLFFPTGRCSGVGAHARMASTVEPHRRPVPTRRTLSRGALVRPARRRHPGPRAARAAGSPTPRYAGRREAACSSWRCLRRPRRHLLLHLDGHRAARRPARRASTWP